MKKCVRPPDAQELFKVVKSKNQNVKKIVSLINKGVDVNEKNSFGYTALALAVQYKKEKVVQKLLSLGADLSILDKFGRTALNQALEYCSSQSYDHELYVGCSQAPINLDTVKILINSGADVHTADLNGHTALHFAVESNDVDFIEQLLSLGINVNSKNNCNQMPLFKAAINNRGSRHLKAAKILLKNGADVNLQDQDGKIPLYKLVRRASTEIVQLFINFGSDVNKGDENPLFEAILSKNLGVVQLLLNHGANVHSRNKLGHTPLQCAITSGNIKIIKCLLNNGADIDAQDHKGCTPFLYLMEYPYYNNNLLQTVIFLFKYADVNIVNLEGKNILNIESALVNFEHPWKITLEHLAKLQALAIPLNQSFFDTILNNEKYDTYFKKCAEELSMAQKSKFHNSWASYFNLLVDSKRKLKNYAGNEDLVTDFQSCNCVEKFPIYGAKIQKNMEKGIKHRVLFDKSTILLSKCLPILNPTHLITFSILDCLSRKDLQELCG